MGLQDRFQLLGTVTDIPAFLAELDIAVLCSQTEGAPNAIMEYMVAGLPIVATAVGGNAEMIQAETTAYWCRPATRDSWLRLSIVCCVMIVWLHGCLPMPAKSPSRSTVSKRTSRRYESLYFRLADKSPGSTLRPRAITSASRESR